MENEKQTPKVGVGVMILKEGKVLLDKRKAKLAEGEYGFPGGHLEHMERFEDAVLREIEEECGIKVKNIKFCAVSNVIKYAPKHYVTIGFTADWESGEPKILEPHKAESWGWYDLDDLPSPLLEMSSILIEAYKNKNNYFDIK